MFNPEEGWGGGDREWSGAHRSMQHTQHGVSRWHLNFYHHPLPNEFNDGDDSWGSRKRRRGLSVKEVADMFLAKQRYLPGES